jgi:hypothetical protein
LISAIIRNRSVPQRHQHKHINSTFNAAQLGYVALLSAIQLTCQHHHQLATLVLHLWQQVVQHLSADKPPLFDCIQGHSVPITPTDLGITHIRLKIPAVTQRSDELFICGAADAIK